MATLSKHTIKTDIEHNQQKNISNEGNKEFQLHLPGLNQAKDNSNENQILQSKSHAFRSNVQQLNLAYIGKCTLNHDVDSASLKGNVENDKLKHSNSEVDMFEYSAQNSTASFQSTTLPLCEETKYDPLLIHSKVCF